MCGDMDLSDMQLTAELQKAKITQQVDDMVDKWRWNRDEEVKAFPPEVQKYLLKDWEPGKL